MNTYEVQWSKRYYAAGYVEIEAENKEEAKKIAEEHIGDYEGSTQYDPDGDDIYVLGTKERMNEYMLAMKKEIAEKKSTKCCGELGMGCAYEGDVELMTKHPKYDGYLCPKCTGEMS